MIEITLSDIEKYLTYATYAITIASTLANFLPHPQEEKVNGIISKISKAVNFLALNIRKLK